MIFFVLGEKLYIIMELIDGAPLGEHFNSLKEKGERFSEERLWNIFTQVSFERIIFNVVLAYSCQISCFSHSLFTGIDPQPTFLHCKSS